MGSLGRQCVAEFVGTFALCFFGCGSIVLTASPIEGLDPAGSLITVAVAFAAVLTVFVAACFGISGSQFNPAVSITLTALGMQSASRTAVFVGVQSLAACCGVGAMVFVLGSNAEYAVAMDTARHGASLGALSVGEGANAVGAFAMEALLTFALMFVILTVVVGETNRLKAGAAVGVVVAACITGFGPLTGASMNPARSLGPAVYGHWEMHWVYWAAPICGALLAGVVWKVAFAEKADND